MWVYKYLDRFDNGFNTKRHRYNTSCIPINAVCCLLCLVVQPAAYADRQPAVITGLQ